MENLNLKILLSFILFNISWLESSSQTVTIEGPEFVCPGEVYSYSYSSSETWCVSSWGNVFGGTVIGSWNDPVIRIKWDLMAGVREVEVYSDCGDVSKFISSKVPEKDPTPQNIIINSGNTFCPGNTISLTAISDYEYNNDEFANNDVYYIWERSIDNGSWLQIMQTDQLNINFAVPDVTYNSDSYKEVRFRIVAKYKICPNIQSEYFTSTSIGYIYAKAPELIYNVNNKSCNNPASITVTDVTGVGDISTVYELRINDGSIFFDGSELPKDVILPKAGTFDYQLFYAATKKCTAERTITINDDSYNLNITEASLDAGCHQEASGSIDLTLNNGQAPFTYSWSNGASTEDISNLSAGIYSVTVTDNNGCTGGLSIEIGEPPVITISDAYVSSNYNGQQISCNAGSDGKITVEANGGTGILQYKVAGGIYQTSNVITGLSAGNYTIYVKDENGCELQYTSIVEIIAPDAIGAAITGVDPKCSGGASGSLSVSASGGTGSYAYSVNGTTYQVSNVFDNLPAADYMVWVKDQNGCIKSFSKVITDPPPITLTASTTPVSCSGGSDGTITVNEVSNGTGPFTYSIDGEFFQGSKMFTGINSQSYSIIAKDANGCMGTVSVFVDSKPPLVGTIAESASISCNTATDGSLSLTPSGGTPPYTFLWSTGATTKDLINIGAGTYSITITDATGCYVAKDYTLTEPFALRADAFPSDYNGAGVSCNGAANGAIDVAVTGGTTPYSFSWSNGQSTEDLANLSPGFYSVVITDVNNCAISINNIEITNPLPVGLVVSDQNNVDCKGNATGSVTVAASGGVQNYEYTIDGATWQASNTFTNLTVGSYTIMVRDANGCLASVSTTITEPEQLTGKVFNIVESTCGEDNGSAEAQAAGGTENYTYTWTNSSDVVVGNAAVLSGVGGGIYSVQITDANGCTIEMTANISSADGPQTTVTDIVSTSCFDSNDGRATLNISGSAPFEVVWGNGETSTSATALYPGDNVVTITDVNGCVAVEVVNIPAPDPISYTITSAVIPTCHDTEDGSLEVTASGGSGSYMYVWETGVEGNSLQNISSGLYALTISDANGCVLQTTVTLEEVEPLQVLVENSTLPTCVGDADGSLVVSASGGNGDYSYSWSTGAAGTTLDQIAAGTYEVTVTDSKGCTLTESIELPDPEPFVIDLGNDVEICTGSSYVITAPVADATYHWTADNGFTSTDQKVILSEQGVYNLHVTNLDGCEAEDSFALNISDDLLDADFLMATEGYAGDTIVIIDISWPIPDELTWTFGDDVTVVMENKDYAEVVFEKPGTYAIDIEVGLADCRDFYSQAITILGQEEVIENGRIAVTKQELIKTFKVSPNPTDGAFKVEVELNRQISIRLAMVDLTGNRIVMDNRYTAKTSYDLDLNMPDLTSGIYMLTLQAAGKIKTLRLMVK